MYNILNNFGPVPALCWAEFHSEGHSVLILPMSLTSTEYSANFWWSVINSKGQKSYSTTSIVMHYIYCTIQTKNCTPSVEGKIEWKQTFIKSNETGAIQFKILLIHTRVTREGNYKQYVKWCTFETSYQSWKKLLSSTDQKKSKNINQMFWSPNKKTLRICIIYIV